MLPRLPLIVINKITKYVSEINNDKFIITFCDVGKISRKTNRLCSCCKIRTRMYLLLDKEKFEPKLATHFNIKKTYKKQTVCVDDYVNEGDMICIKSRNFTYPRWFGETEELKLYETYIISYKTELFGTEYVVLKDVCIDKNGKKTCLDGIIINPELPKKNQITEIRKMSFSKFIEYIDDELIHFDVINIITK